MPATDMQVNSPGNGALVNANETLTTGYSTALDVRRTTNLATDGAFGPLGGIAALYVQHKVAGSGGANAQGNWAIRAAMETTQTVNQGGAYVQNDAVGVYSAIGNRGQSSVGYAFYCDVVHASSVGTFVTATYGYVAEMFRTNANGFTAAYVAKSQDGGSATFNNDFGFVIFPGNTNSTHFTRGFSVGGPAIGTAACDIAFDSSYSTGGVGLVVAPNQQILMNGQSGGTPLTDAAFVYVNGLKEIQFNNGLSTRFGVPMDTSASYLFNAASGSRWLSGVALGAYTGKFRIKIDGTATSYYIPVYL